MESNRYNKHCFYFRSKLEVRIGIGFACASEEIESSFSHKFTLNCSMHLLTFHGASSFYNRTQKKPSRQEAPHKLIVTISSSPISFATTKAFGIQSMVLFMFMYIARVSLLFSIGWGFLFPINCHWLNAAFNFFVINSPSSNRNIINSICTFLCAITNLPFQFYHNNLFTF